MNEVSVIIPNWNGANRLRKALGALARSSVQPQTILVVDNGSTDDSISAAREAGATVLSLDQNYGFCRAVNEGVRVSTTQWVAILNNDVEVEPDWLGRLLKACSGSAWFGTGRLLSQDSPGRLDGSFDLISRSGCALRAGHGQPDSGLWLRQEEINFPPFTAVLVRRALFERVGLLDERFVSYLEDVEFGLRCALEGLTGLYVPEAAARHAGSATYGAWSPAMVRLLARNQLFLIARHYPTGWASRYGRQVLVGQLLWGLLAIRRGALLPWLAGKYEGLRRFRELRGPAASGSPARLDEILHRSEDRIRQLQMRDGGDWFWRTYFRLCGVAG